ncbi:HAD-like protein [Atractiella rhizophila]|nr:HAD-like protein [Atractiella rhizophila]
MGKKVVCCFDVLGTCFHLSNVVDTIHSELKEELGVDAITAQLLVYNWYHASQRDFTYLAPTCYTPIMQVFEKSIAKAFLPYLPSLSSASKAALRDPQSRITTTLMSALKTLSPRPGLVEGMNALNAKGIDCWAVTNGGKEGTINLFERVDKTGKWFAGPQNLADRVISCDEIEAAKPDQRVYRYAKRRVCESSSLAEDQIEFWFIATHSWDLHSAKKAGFKTAWVSLEEHDPSIALFGEPDILAESFPSVAQQIIERAL